MWFYSFNLCSPTTMKSPMRKWRRCEESQTKEKTSIRNMVSIRLRYPCSPSLFLPDPRTNLITIHFRSSQMIHTTVDYGPVYQILQNHQNRRRVKIVYSQKGYQHPELVIYSIRIPHRWWDCINCIKIIRHITWWAPINIINTITWWCIRGALKVESVNSHIDSTS